MGFVIGGLLSIRADAAILQPLLDQYSPPNQSLFAWEPNEIDQQGVTAGITGTLSSVSLYEEGQGGTFNFFINIGSPWQSDQNDFETQVTVQSQGWFTIDVSAADIQLVPGTHYIIGVKGSPYLMGNDNGYSRGALWYSINNNTPGLDNGGDLAFATHVVPIPEPSISMLCMVALSMFVVAHRYRSISRRLQSC